MLKSRLLFSGGIALAVCAVILLENKNIGFSILYALALLLLLSLALAFAARRCIKLEETISADTLFKNETITYTLTLRNKSPLLFTSLRLVFAQHKRIACTPALPERLDLLPFANFKKQFVLRFAYRGVYPVGALELVVPGFLGLFRVKLQPAKKPPVLVFPQIDDTFALLAQGEATRTSPNTDLFFEDYSSITDVRRHNPNENLRHVHWKLSAKRGELMVKNYEFFAPDRILLLLDTKAIAGEEAVQAALEDKMASHVAGAVSTCIGGRIPASLLYADKLLEIDGGSDISAVFAELSAAEFSGGASTVFALPDQTGCDNMHIYLSHITQELHEHICGFVRESAVFVYYFYAYRIPTPHRPLLESLSAMGVRVHLIKWEEPNATQK